MDYLFTIKFHSSTKKQLKKIPSLDQNKIISALKKLKQYPPPSNLNIKKLSGTKHFYRLRTGSLRIIFEKDLKKKTIYIWKLGYRQNIYQ